MEGILIIFLGMAAIQLFFYSLAVLKFSTFKQKERLVDIEDVPVSIIIASHNNLKTLEKLLGGLFKQAYGKFEVIVVDDRSQDGTFEYLQEAKKSHSNLVMVRVENTPPHINEKKYALTLGIKVAKNDCLLFTDADCEPSSIHWIRNMTNPFKDGKEFVLGFSYYRKYSGILNQFIRHETLQTGMLYLSMALVRLPYMGVGRNLGFRKTFFISKKGYNKYRKVVGGDDDLFVNQFASGSNTQVVIHPESVVVSEPEKSMKSYFRQKIRHLSTGKRYRSKHKLFLGIFSFSKLLFWTLGVVFLVLGKAVYPVIGTIFGVLFMLSCAFRIMAKKLGVKYEIGWAWIMDFVYISYLNVFSLIAFTAKRIKWH